MVKIVTLEKKDAQAYLANQAGAYVERVYPTFSAAQKARLIRKLVIEGKKSLLHGGELTLSVPPLNGWNKWKEKHAPIWLKKLSPVRYQEI